MRTANSILSLVVFLSWSLSLANAGDWTTWRSTYTHDPYTQQRVDQYAQVQNPPAPDQSDLQKSGYRNYRSTLQGAYSADNLHIVNEWGKPVLPYEQWRFPFRPYAVPYGAWGPQPPLVQGVGGWGFPGAPWWSGGAGGPGMPGPGMPGGGAPGGGFPGGGFPGGGFPGAGFPGAGFPPNAGFPYGLGPNAPAGYNQPWFNGSYPQAPPLDNRTDRQFFYQLPAN